MPINDFRRRGLLAFDVAGSIPAGLRVSRAALTLHVSRTLADSVSVGLHRAIAEWGEGASDAGSERGGDGAPASTGDATWIHRVSPDALWATAGGDFAAPESARADVAAIGSYTWESPAMADDVQMWLDSPAATFGWELIGDETRMGTTKRFDSRENGVESNRPTLLVEFVFSGTGKQLPGDCNQDVVLDVSDAICLFGVLFTGVPRRFPCASGRPGDPANVTLLDWQPDGQVDISDGIGLLLFLFGGGPPHPLAIPGQETRACIEIETCPDRSDRCR